MKKWHVTKHKKADSYGRNSAKWQTMEKNAKHCLSVAANKDLFL